MSPVLWIILLECKLLSSVPIQQVIHRGIIYRQIFDKKSYLWKIVSVSKDQIWPISIRTIIFFVFFGSVKPWEQRHLAAFYHILWLFTMLTFWSASEMMPKAAFPLKLTNFANSNMYIKYNKHFIDIEPVSFHSLFLLEEIYTQ